MYCRTQLVEHDSESADQIKKCIDEWIKAGLASGRVFPISGSNVTVSSTSTIYTSYM